MASHPPAVSVVGARNSGKTTLMERLIAEIRGRGLRVAAVKKDAHGFDMDHEGKDTWRMRRAGADAIGICCGGEAAFLLRREEPWSIDEIVEKIGAGCDLVLVEGLAGSPLPKVVVLREGRQWKHDPARLMGTVAVVAEAGDYGPLPRYHPEDAAGIATRVLEVAGLLP